jgi:hypothetical protein
MKATSMRITRSSTSAPEQASSVEAEVVDMTDEGVASSAPETASATGTSPVANLDVGAISSAAMDTASDLSLAQPISISISDSAGATSAAREISTSISAVSGTEELGVATNALSTSLVSRDTADPVLSSVHVDTDVFIMEGSEDVVYTDSDAEIMNAQNVSSVFEASVKTAVSQPLSAVYSAGTPDTSDEETLAEHEFMSSSLMSSSTQLPESAISSATSSVSASAMSYSSSLFGAVRFENAKCDQTAIAEHIYNVFRLIKRKLPPLIRETIPIVF